MDCSCNLIQDLLPACLSGSCTPETEAAQWEYEMNQLEKWGIVWILRECFIRLRRNRTVVRKGISLLAAPLFLRRSRIILRGS